MVMAATFASGAALIAIVILAGVGIGTNSDALVSALAESRKLGASIGAAQSCKEFGDMVGPLLVGLLTQLYGVRTGFVSCGVLALLCVIPLARTRALPTRGAPGLPVHLRFVQLNSEYTRRMVERGTR
jgi:MFS family permease